LQVNAKGGLAWETPFNVTLQLLVTGSDLSGNAEGGMLFDLKVEFKDGQGDAPGDDEDTFVEVVGCNIVDNGQDGIWIKGAPVIVSGSRLCNNEGNGILILEDEVFADLGGGSWGSNGHNYFFGNGEYDINSRNKNTTYALYNDWGTLDEIEIAKRVYGNVIFCHPLEPVALCLGSDDCCGDFNLDGEVDEDDYYIFLAAFGTCQGHPDYVPAADYDRDGCITLVDYQEWIMCFRDCSGE